MAHSPLAAIRVQDRLARALPTSGGEGCEACCEACVLAPALTGCSVAVELLPSDSVRARQRLSSQLSPDKHHAVHDSSARSEMAVGGGRARPRLRCSLSRARPARSLLMTRLRAL